jgi:hypothetical protein
MLIIAAYFVYESVGHGESTGAPLVEETWIYAEREQKNSYTLRYLSFLKSQCWTVVGWQMNFPAFFLSGILERNLLIQELIIFLRRY